MSLVFRKISCLAIFLLVLGCAADDNLDQQIRQLESDLAQSPNDQTLRDLDNLYQLAAKKADQEGDRLKYQWRTGETARALKEFDRAAQILSGIYEDNPESEYSGKALFLHAFMLDEDQQKYTEAGELYRRFILNYPDSDFNDDAQFLLKNLGKSDEEILRTLTEKADEQSSN